MEIKTCEQYVLNELEETKNALAEMTARCSSLETELVTVQHQCNSIINWYERYIKENNLVNPIKVGGDF